jgi:microsomal epoxide hydrolase
MALPRPALVAAVLVLLLAAAVALLRHRFASAPAYVHRPTPPGWRWGVRHDDDGIPSSPSSSSLPIPYSPASSADAHHHAGGPLRLPTVRPLPGTRPWENGIPGSLVRHFATLFADRGTNGTVASSPNPLLARARAEFTWKTSTIRGLMIGYIHQQPQPPQGDAVDPSCVVPLLLLHGWPGSVLEFLDIIPLLTSPTGRRGVVDSVPSASHCPSSSLVFAVVAPSLPGYGLSDAPEAPGFDPVAAAEVFLELMTKTLGYGRFLVQAGDWGALIAACMAQIDPHAVVGLHLNFVTPGANPFAPLAYAVGFGAGEGASEEEKEEAARAYPRVRDSHRRRAPHPPPNALQTLVDVTGYMHIQATRPDTLAAALQASPVAWLAWVGEKYWEWSDVREATAIALASGRWRPACDEEGPGVPGDPPSSPCDTAYHPLLVLQDRALVRRSRAPGGLQQLPADWRPDPSYFLALVELVWARGHVAPSLRFYAEALQSDRFAAAMLARVDVPTAVADFPFELGRVPSSLLRFRFPRLVRQRAMPRGGHFAALEEPELLAQDLFEVAPRLLEEGGWWG